jgi:hypothetical protein
VLLAGQHATGELGQLGLFILALSLLGLAGAVVSARLPELEGA